MGTPFSFSCLGSIIVTFVSDKEQIFAEKCTEAFKLKVFKYVFPVASSENFNSDWILFIKINYKSPDSF